MNKSRVFKGLLIALTLAAIGLAAVPAFAGGPFQYHAVTPCRVADSRVVNATQNLDGNPLGHGQHCFLIQSQCGIPNGAAAITANFTIVQPQGAGHLVLAPNDGTTMPVVSTLNYNAGEPALANGAIVPLAAPTFPACSNQNTTGNVAGDLRAQIATTGTSHFIIDVTGYFQ